MKKVFAILLVLAVFAGFVFADDPATPSPSTENHKITLRTYVEGYIPQFQFSYESGALTGESSTTNSNKVDFVDGANYEGNNIVDIADLSQKGVDVSFKILLANSKSKIQAKSYDFAVTAGRFTVERGVKGTDSYLGASSAVLTTNNLAGSTDTYATWNATEVSTGANSEVLTSGSNGIISTIGTELTRSATVTFNAKDASAEDGAILATFAVSYPQDKTILPNANASEKYEDGYTADITVAITSNN